MRAEGMVHALSTIRKLLKPRGVLIDIHPGSQKPELFVRLGSGRHFVGYLEEMDNFVEYVQAQAALEASVQNGTFRADHAGKFAFVTYADTLPALQTYLAENWKDAILTPSVLHAAAAVFEQPGAHGIELVEQIAIARFKPGPEPTG
jgi:hypothetical protein